MTVSENDGPLTAFKEFLNTLVHDSGSEQTDAVIERLHTFGFPALDTAFAHHPQEAPEVADELRALALLLQSAYADGNESDRLLDWVVDVPFLLTSRIMARRHARIFTME